MELVENAEESERPLLKEYLLEHVTVSDEWNRARVPCGDWSKDYAGRELCQTTLQTMHSFPDVKEVYCPPGTFKLLLPEHYENHAPVYSEPREVCFIRGFWVQETPVTEGLYRSVMGGDIPSRKKP